MERLIDRLPLGVNTYAPATYIDSLESLPKEALEPIQTDISYMEPYLAFLAQSDKFLTTTYL